MSDHDLQHGYDERARSPLTTDDVLRLDDDHNAVVCIDPDGTTSVWLFSPDPDAGDQPAPPTPAPEELGQLPAEFRDRLRGIVRCGAPTRDGHPCRNEAARCQWHQQERAS